MKSFHLDNSHRHPVDLAKLLDTKLFIQGASGSGKTHLVRRVLELTHGQVQQIVLDPEGEYSPLREKFDYILAGKGGDVPAEPRSAHLLAIKLLELGSSCIVDLYELKEPDRRLFVKNFIDAMMNSPKNLHHPVLVVLDEADKFVPENGESVSTSSVIDLSSRGRKRGFCLALATQRIAMVSKSATANCQNRLIGLCVEDVDQKRAAQILGFGKDAERGLRDLEIGEFWAFGPAIAREVHKVKIGDVTTPEPKPGMAYKMKAPKPSAETLAAIKKLVDLPKEAEAEAKTIEQLKRDLAELKRHRCPTGASQEDLVRGMAQAAVAERKRLHGLITPVMCAKLKNYRNRLEDVVNDLRQFEEMVLENLETENPHAFVMGDPLAVIKNPSDGFIPSTSERGQKLRKMRAELPRVVTADEFLRSVEMPGDKKPLSGAALKMAEVLVAYHPEALTVSRLCALAGYKPKVSTTRNALSILRTGGYLDEVDGHYAASETLRAVLPAPTPMTSEEKISKWRKELGGAALAIFNALLETNDKIGKEDLAFQVNIDSNKSTWRNGLSQLRVRGLIVEDNDCIALTKELFA